MCLSEESGSEEEGFGKFKNNRKLKEIEKMDHSRPESGSESISNVSSESDRPQSQEKSESSSSPSNSGNDEGVIKHERLDMGTYQKSDRVNKSYKTLVMRA